MAEIAASVLNADASKWREWLSKLEKAKVDRIQFDIMDNKYVPNRGVDKNLILQLRPSTKIFFETHLMVENPEKYVDEFARLGSQLIIFHVETVSEPKKLINKIKSLGVQAGIAMNSNTGPEKIAPYLHQVDLALVMGVDAGFGGQKFKPKALDKIKVLRKKIDSDGLSCLIEVDGGINVETAHKAIYDGADVLVAGTFLFANPKGIIEGVKELRKA